MGWQWMEGAGWWAMGAGMLLWVLVLAVVVGLVVWAINRTTGSAGGARSGGDSAEEVLRRRFAAGEIDAEEYERRLTVLRQHG